MTRELAKEIQSELKKKNDAGAGLSILEIMSMVQLPSDGYEIYAIQKGDVTVLAWKRSNGSIITKIQCW